MQTVTSARQRQLVGSESRLDEVVECTCCGRNRRCVLLCAVAFAIVAALVQAALSWPIASCVSRIVDEGRPAFQRNCLVKSSAIHKRGQRYLPELNVLIVGEDITRNARRFRTSAYSDFGTEHEATEFSNMYRPGSDAACFQFVDDPAAVKLDRETPDLSQDSFLMMFLVIICMCSCGCCCICIYQFFVDRILDAPSDGEDSDDHSEAETYERSSAVQRHRSHRTGKRNERADRTRPLARRDRPKVLGKRRAGTSVSSRASETEVDDECSSASSAPSSASAASNGVSSASARRGHGEGPRQQPTRGDHTAALPTSDPARLGRSVQEMAGPDTGRVHVYGGSCRPSQRRRECDLESGAERIGRGSASRSNGGRSRGRTSSGGRSSDGRSSVEGSGSSSSDGGQADATWEDTRRSRRIRREMRREVRGPRLGADEEDAIAWRRRMRASRGCLRKGGLPAR